ncbi:hypothetical protein [Paracoccus sp. (in: a-proteobacteria)]|uniref:hypothetical protein n=1 Tax=Paracoccus sp. TaxID=267 RepID=UPI00321FCE02
MIAAALPPLALGLVMYRCISGSMIARAIKVGRVRFARGASSRTFAVPDLIRDLHLVSRDQG